MRFRESLVTIALLAAVAVPFAAGAAFAGDADTAQAALVPSPMELQLGAIEDKLFGEKHEHDTVEVRLGRVEKFIYGTASDGSPESRFQHLKDDLLQKMPDGRGSVSTILSAVPPAAAIPVAQPSAAVQSAATGNASADSGTDIWKGLRSIQCHGAHSKIECRA